MSKLTKGAIQATISELVKWNERDLRRVKSNEDLHDLAEDLRKIAKK